MCVFIPFIKAGLYFFFYPIAGKLRLQHLFHLPLFFSHFTAVIEDLENNASGMPKEGFDTPTFIPSLLFYWASEDIYCVVTRGSVHFCCSVPGGDFLCLWRKSLKQCLHTQSRDNILPIRSTNAFPPIPWLHWADGSHGLWPASETSPQKRPDFTQLKRGWGGLRVQALISKRALLIHRLA